MLGLRGWQTRPQPLGLVVLLQLHSRHFVLQRGPSILDLEPEQQRHLCLERGQPIRPLLQISSL